MENFWSEEVGTRVFRLGEEDYDRLIIASGMVMMNSVEISLG